MGIVSDCFAEADDAPGGWMRPCHRSSTCMMLRHLKPRNGAPARSFRVRAGAGPRLVLLPTAVCREPTRRIFLVALLLLASSCASPQTTAEVPIRQAPSPPRASSVGPDQVIRKGTQREAEPPSPVLQREGAATEAGVLRVAVISDLNSGYGSTRYVPAVHQAVEDIVAWHPDLVICTGDMVAGQRRGLDYEAMWEAFHQAVSEPLRKAGVPLAVSPGNHDASPFGAYAAEREAYVEAWQSRPLKFELLEESEYPLYYAFRLSGVLFIAMDLARAGALDGRQRAWLERTMASNVMLPRPVVFGHVPLFPFSVGRDSEVTSDAALLSSLHDHQAHVFSGHHQVYYSGLLNSLHLVSVPCLGTGPRQLRHTHHRSARGYVRLHFIEGELVHWEQRVAPDYQPSVTMLPATLTYGDISVNLHLPSARVSESGSLTDEKTGHQ